MAITRENKSRQAEPQRAHCSPGERFSGPIAVRLAGRCLLENRRDGEKRRKGDSAHPRRGKDHVCEGVGTLSRSPEALTALKQWAYISCGTCVRNRINLSRSNYKEPYIRQSGMSVAAPLA
ncbi:hypothetical protein KM043_014490 [Ampulex compressa]|nr:hypothetical protein KM043_014490 [Ampulex compressa]